MLREPEYYLGKVKGWHDPYPEPVLKMVDGIMVVRDDMLGVGTKVRFLDALIGREKEIDEWVFGSAPRIGYGQVSLSYVCKQYKKKCRLFLAKSKVWHQNTVRAKQFGATIIEEPVGFLSVTRKRAADYAAKSKKRKVLPIGLGDDLVYGAIIKIARALPFTPDEVWTVAGGGALNRGLQLAWPHADCYMVSIGHQLTEEEKGRAKKVFRHYLPFNRACRKEMLPPFPSVIEYDAKAWEFVQKYANKKHKVLFWNVA